ncbi:DUF5360 family protein [Streptomyces xantholiticus]|uniref:DUF5360 family protein n=1 Tax=Streptomyces xantholiticus TaxID=68285 RepID=UPI00167B66F5|nr:DUF5360 family protein [Streptomyces xantholiticus]GGW35304.1 hypothetical protein GCM10010381_20130 [Streptomyces xantholiticus]
MDRQRGFRPGHGGDVREGPGLLAHRTASLPVLVPARHACKDYDDPVTNDWNHSFLPLDVTAGATGLAAPFLLRCGAPGVSRAVGSLGRAADAAGGGAAAPGRGGAVRAAAEPGIQSPR